MTGDSTSDDLTPDQQDAIADAELLAGYAQLSHDHLEQTGEDVRDLRDQGAPQSEVDSAVREGMRWVPWTFLVLLAIVLILFAAFASGGSEASETDPPAQSAAAEQPGESSPGNASTADDGGSSATELETQDPVPLAGGAWIFFADESESRGVYTIQFATDGSCAVPSDPHIYNGVYVVNGSSVEITLFHGEQLEAGSFSQWHENEEVFHMTRTGNAMRGPWEVEDMYYSEEGLVVEGTRINLPDVYARPVQGAEGE